MHVALTAPYVDVRAADLILAVDAPPVVPLQVLRAELAGLTIELGLLGHSHQIVVPELALTETVACRPGVPGDLPASHERGRYRFTAEVLELDAGATQIAERVAADAHGLVGVFAGDAFTALRATADAGGARWETWHAYPQTGELVHTTGTVR